MPIRLSELSRLLRGLRPRALTSSSLARVLAGVELSRESLSPWLSFRRGGYTRNLVHRDDRFELLILCWDGGSRSPVHDHAGQHCFFTPIYGSFAVDDYAKGDERSVVKERTLVLGPGEVDHRQAGDNEIHRVSVQSPGPAISLHVYAKPIERCAVFDEESATWKEKTLRYDRKTPGRTEGPSLLPFPLPPKRE